MGNIGFDKSGKREFQNQVSAKDEKQASTQNHLEIKYKTLETKNGNIAKKHSDGRVSYKYMDYNALKKII